MISARLHRHHDNICSTGKGQKWFYGEPGLVRAPRVSYYYYYFFFNDIDERRRYTKKVHPLKALVGPPIVKRRIKGDLWAGWGLKVSVDAGLKQLKVISRREDGGW